MFIYYGLTLTPWSLRVVFSIGARDKQGSGSQFYRDYFLRGLIRRPANNAGVIEVFRNRSWLNLQFLGTDISGSGVSSAVKGRRSGLSYLLADGPDLGFGKIFVACSREIPMWMWNEGILPYRLILSNPFAINDEPREQLA
jgi:hypothetical protein